MKPLLSILIPAIPSRWEKSVALYNHIVKMVDDKNIEVLMLTDNKKRTIGEKREALKNIANGKYFMFVDDDDNLFMIEQLYKAAQKDVDVITFKVKCFNSDGSEYIVTFGLGNEVEHKSKNGRYVDLNRPPFHQCAWSEKFKHIPYPPLMFAEDWGWVKQVLPLAKTEIHINEVLMAYNFDPNVSEAVVEHDIATRVTVEGHCKTIDVTPKKRCVVNLVTHNEAYIRGQKRLQYKMQSQDIPLITFIGEHAVGAPQHKDNPYAFKIYAIEKVRAMGYEQILWVDASVYPVNRIEPVFEWLDKCGIFLEEAGHYAGRWATDEVLKYFQLPREIAYNMPMFAAGYCGFDFTRDVSREFFKRWKDAMLAGAFKGNWDESRHDMTAGSIIANQMGLLEYYSPGGQFFAYVGDGFEQPKPTAVFHLKGMA